MVSPNDLLDPRILTTVVSVFAATVAGIAGAGKVVLWFMARQFRTTLDAIDRIPPASWFEGVDEALKRVPSEDLLKRIVHSLEKDGKQDLTNLDHAGRLSAVELSVRDHESRIRLLEKGQ